MSAVSAAYVAVCDGYPLVEGMASMRKKTERGFALAELLMVTALMVTSLGAIASLFLSTASLREQDRELEAALTACQNALEALRSTPIADLPIRDGGGFAAPGLDPVTGDVDGFPGSITVTVDSTDGTTTIYRVTTRVDWQGRSGTQDFSLHCLMGDRASK